MPPSSSYYMDVGKLPPTLPRLPTLKAWEWRAASTLFDIHSRICAWRLLASWRCRELVTAALHAFDDKQLIVASALVRPLLENAAALCVKSILLARTWPLEGARALRNEPAVLQWRADASRLIAQPLWGTRQRKMISELSPERTNILTFIDKAAKQLGKPDLRSIYERLCDVVHPGLGANSAYYSRAGRQGGFSDFVYVEISSRVTSDFDQIQTVFSEAWKWSLQMADTGLRRLARIADCLCMTAKLYAYEDLLYWGVVRPSGEYDSCPCGSGFKLRFCNHVIPDDVIGPGSDTGRHRGNARR